MVEDNDVRLNELAVEAQKVLDSCYTEIESGKLTEGVTKMYSLIGYVTALFSELVDVIRGDEDGESTADSTVEGQSEVGEGCEIARPEFGAGSKGD